jgi:hypothetical protein
MDMDPDYLIYFFNGLDYGPPFVLLGVIVLLSVAESDFLHVLLSDIVTP